MTSAPASAQAPDTTRAIRALAEFADACRRVASPWPAELCGRLVLVDPQTRLAVANAPDAGGRFQSRGGAFVGEWPEALGIANTALEWEGDRWAMVMLPLPDDTLARLQLLAHESFHRIQPALGHEAADPLASHLDEEEGRVWLRLELRAYARALASEGDVAREAARDGLLFRRVRQAAFPGAAEVERQLEAHEGLAEYTGARFALDAMGAVPGELAGRVEAFERRPSYVRSLGYGTGPALGLLLDRYAPGWRRELGRAPDLARRLAVALGAPDAEPDRALAGRRAAAYGGEVVRAEEAERAARLAESRARYRRELVDGPVLHLSGPGLLFMFNPNTVLPLGDDGHVYPHATIEGPWGRLTIHEGGALAPPTRDRARVAAPERAEPGPDGTVNGPGWVLELAPGWRLAPGPRAGDYRVVLAEEAG